MEKWKFQHWKFFLWHLCALKNQKLTCRLNLCLFDVCTSKHYSMFKAIIYEILLHVYLWSWEFSGLSVQLLNKHLRNLDVRKSAPYPAYSNWPVLLCVPLIFKMILNNSWRNWLHVLLYDILICQPIIPYCRRGAM